VAELLIEVGFEEMPAAWLPGLREQARQRFEDLAAREHLRPAVVESFSTPRRLVVRAELPARQADREERVWGPPLKIAKDASGNWTKAAEGFARKNGVRVDDLVPAVRGSAEARDGLPAGSATDRSEQYLLHVRKIAGNDAHAVLPAIAATWLRALTFPKRMSWDAWLEDGKGAFPFGRPIRWLILLLDGAVVPFTIHAMEAGARGAAIVTSGATTLGHRFLPRDQAKAPLAVRSFADLRDRLQESYVLLDPAEREARIRKALAETGAGGSHHAVDLAAEWGDLVEYPTVLTGRIPAEFQHLPTEVLETVLVHHQKYIPVTVDGKVVRFAALTNTDGAAAAEIVRGMERVVVARLRDAAFFYAEDRKRRLQDRVGDLAGVTFHKQLGTYEDKTRRMVRLVECMGAQMGLLTKPEVEAARMAAGLAKADLTTLIVREFPELQGTMGGIYLSADGQAWPVVSDAVRWHYHPLSVEEGSPPAKKLAGSDATVFGAVSIADKLDTLAGYFGLGLVPTGSSDPFGLRRAAQGVVRVLIDFWHADDSETRPSVQALVREAIAGYGDRLPRPAAEVARDLEAFFLDRIRSVFIARGFAPDEVEAVLGAREPDALGDPHEAWRRVQALHRVRLEATEDFEALAVAFKRAKNIGADRAPATVDASLLREDAERQLHDAVSRMSTSDGGYESRLRSLAGLRAPVDRFFDDVLVMADDPAVRANRLGLLSQALSLFYRIADISKLGG
jgi:glycyl-tRNA synthetase beta chain